MAKGLKNAVKYNGLFCSSCRPPIPLSFGKAIPECSEIHDDDRTTLEKTRKIHLRYSAIFYHFQFILTEQFHHPKYLKCNRQKQELLKLKKFSEFFRPKCVPPFDFLVKCQQLFCLQATKQTSLWQAFG